MDLYERTAEAYDLIQEARGHSYAADAAELTRLIRERNGAASSLLDVACGSGLHLVEFAKAFDTVAGLDVSPRMLERAAQVVPGSDLQLGDMRDFSLGRTFDAVTCLFSSIGYMLTIEDLGAAVAAMAVHLSPGGVLVVEPWLQPEHWIVPHLTAESARSDDVVVARASTNGVRGRVSTFTLHWTILTADSVDYVVEEHAMGLFTQAEYEAAFAAAGLTVESFQGAGAHGRGLFVATKPAGAR